MTSMTLDTRQWARWIAGFVGFPIAGLAARAVAGPIDSWGAAATGGLAAGAALGFVQTLARGDRGERRLRWVSASAFGMAAGLAAGAGAVGFDTDPASLVAMGAITGTGIGIAQSVVLASTTRRRVAWAFGTPGLWALGWLVTSQVIVDAGAHHASFGSSGAIVVTALSGLLHPAITGAGRAGTAVVGQTRRSVLVTETIEIDRPAGEVWAAIADYAFDLRWRDGLVEMSPVPAGPPRDGTRVHEVLRSSGLTFTTDTVVSDVEPGVTYRFAGQGTTGSVRGRRRVEAALPARSSFFTYEVELQPSGVFGVLRSVLRLALGSGLRKDLQRLKQLMENPTDGLLGEVEPAGGADVVEPLSPAGTGVSPVPHR